jgi:Amidase
VSSETYVGTLLERARAHADLNAFTTIDEAAVLEAARDADRSLQAGRRAPLLGVPLAVKDNYLTKGLTTTFGTSVLATFTPTRDAAAVAAVKDAGAIVFGKNNLVEMSYGLTGGRSPRGRLEQDLDLRVQIPGDDQSRLIPGWREKASHRSRGTCRHHCKINEREKHSLHDVISLSSGMLPQSPQESLVPTK